MLETYKKTKTKGLSFFCELIKRKMKATPAPPPDQGVPRGGPHIPRWQVLVFRRATKNDCTLHFPTRQDAK